MRFHAFFRSHNFLNVLKGWSRYRGRMVYVAPTIFSGIMGGILVDKFISRTDSRYYSPFIQAVTYYADDGDTKKKSKRSMYNFIADAVDIVAPSVVYLEVKLGRGRSAISSAGSGVIVAEEGIIVTSGHVVSNVSMHDFVSVRFSNGEEYEGYVIGIDHNTDLAAVKLKNPSNIAFPVATIAKSSDVRVGEWVAALGSPFGLSNTVTCGIVSTLHRSGGELKIKLKSDMEYIQTDAAINIGNSGGPLINLDGEVIGINCMTVQGASGISFAVPSNVVVEFLNQAKKHSTSTNFPNRRKDVDYYIGVSLLTLKPSILHQFQAKDPDFYGSVEEGVWVGRVSPSSPAGISGLSPGDIITSVNGQIVKSVSEFLNEVKKGELLTVEVQRGHETLTLHVKPELVKPRL